MGAASPIDIELKIADLRGRMKGIERDQKGLEDVHRIRYDHIIEQHAEFKKELANTKAELKTDLTAQTTSLKSDINGVKSSLGKYFLLALTILIALCGWALKSLWSMQEDTNRALIQMTVKAPSNSPALPYLSADSSTPRDGH